ncbi:MAG: exodeoxyribonuclease V subunit alpha [Gammaproteobacteria bacterium]
MLDRLEALCRRGVLNEVDVHFSKLMVRLGKSDEPGVVLAACLASHWTGQGHVCVDLRALAGRPVFTAASEIALFAPPLESWLAVLVDSPVVGREGEYRPLVLDQSGRLYLYRYWHYERTIAESLRARATRTVASVDVSELRAGLRRLFPASPAGEIDWQQVAAAVAVLRHLCVLSGGPGTGKTTTVTRILQLLIEQSPADPPRIALAAPTGKAAARMQEAIAAAKQHLAIEPQIAAAIPDSAFTLHRLLGARVGSPYFRHHSGNPLAVDVLVMDEASMVDVALMAKLLEALPPSARVIMLGDKDQLASVEAGAVLGDICADAEGYSATFRERLGGLLQASLPPAKVGQAPIGDAIVMLRKSFRFGTGGIGALAEAIKSGEGAHCVRLLSARQSDELTWRTLVDRSDLRAGVEESVRAGFNAYLQTLAAQEPPAAVLAAFNRFRVLCAHRHGALGADELNALVEARLRRWLAVDTRVSWYPGRPVMVVRNDYQAALFNGDIGIALVDARSSGLLRVFFQAPDGRLRSFAPGRLPPHETVFAMTVHKAQGSEFDEVVVVLPLEITPVLTRELVYTAITRARKRVEVWGSESVLRDAVAQSVRRSSGLRERLWRPNGTVTGSELERRADPEKAVSGKGSLAR